MSPDFASISHPTLADLQQLVDLARRSFWESHGHSAPAEDIEAYMNGKLTEETFFTELLDQRNSFRWIHYEGQPAGYSKIILDCPNEFVAAPNVTKMERLYFLEAFHRLGMAQLLFAHNLELAKQANQVGLWLYVWKENHRAVAFYKKLGFEIVGEGDFKISERHYNPNYIMFLGI